MTTTKNHLAVILHYPVKNSVVMWPCYYEVDQVNIDKHFDCIGEELPKEAGFYAFLENNPYKVFVKKQKNNK